MELLKNSYKILIGIILGVVISVVGIYMIIIDDNINSNLSVANVQAATSGTCSSVETKLANIENENKIVTYSNPFITIPNGYSATAYKLNGMVVLTIAIPAGVSGWVDTSNAFSLIAELRPAGYINASYRYASYSDMNKMFLSLNSDGTVYGLFNQALNYNAYAQFVYPVAS